MTDFQFHMQNRIDELKASLENLSAIRLAMALPDPVIVFSGQFEAVFQNKPAVEAFGSVQVGRDIRITFRSPEMVNLLDSVVSDGTKISTNLIERVPLERFFWVTATPIDERVGLFVLLFRDQTEAHRIDRMRSDFIANASHELRTPLASISGFIETLRGPARNDPRSQHQFLDIMQEQTGRMSRLVADLLALSRVEMKKDISPDAQVELGAILDIVVESLSKLAGNLNVDITKLYRDAKYFVAGDRDELVQVFQNLIENALNYGSSGKRVEVGITGSGGRHKTAIEVWVQDYGPGIAKEHLPRITERFYRANTEKEHKGTGLGLSIVKHILARHHAAMVVDSESGKGARFTVTFPSKPV